MSRSEDRVMVAFTTPRPDDSLEVDVTFVDASPELELIVADEDILSEEDIVVGSPPSTSRSMLRVALASVPPPGEVRVCAASSPFPPPAASLREPTRSRWTDPVTRLSPNEEANVADECLATIAREASRARASNPSVSAETASPSPFDLSSAPTSNPFLSSAPASPSPFGFGDAAGIEASLVPPPPPSSSARPTPIVPSSLPVAFTPRLPPVSPPPTRSAVLRPPPSEDGSEVASGSGEAEPIPDASEVIETLPLPVKTPFARAATDERVSMPVFASVAPVTLGKTGATVVVRDRPRTAWLVGSALLGGLAATLMMTFVAPRSSPAPASVATTVAATPPPPPPPPATPVVPVSSPQVIRFTDDDAVAVAAPAPTAHAALAPTAHAAPAPTAHAAPAPTEASTIAHAASTSAKSAAPVASAKPPVSGAARPALSQPALPRAASRQSAPRPPSPSSPSQPTRLPDGSLAL